MKSILKNCTICGKFLKNCKFWKCTKNFSKNYFIIGLFKQLRPSYSCTYTVWKVNTGTSGTNNLFITKIIKQYLCVHTSMLFRNVTMVINSTNKYSISRQYWLLAFCFVWTFVFSFDSGRKKWGMKRETKCTT